MTQKLNFCFKGSRNYVHGTDIVSGLFKLFAESDLTNLDIKFNGIAATNLDVVEGGAIESAKVNLRWFEAGQEKHYQLVENGESIDCRYEYDEDSIIKKTQLDLDRKSIALTESTGYSLCENFVALNKYLLQTIYPQEKGKWYFTRLEQSRIISDDALIEVKLIKNFNFRLTKSDILVDSQVIGSVYFTMVRG